MPSELVTNFLRSELLLVHNFEFQFRMCNAQSKSTVQNRTALTNNSKPLIHMTLTSTFLVVGFFAASFTALMALPVVSLADSNQGSIDCSATSTKAYGRAAELRIDDCDQHKKAAPSSWLQDYLDVDTADLEISSFVTQTLTGELEKEFLALTKQIETYVLKYKKLNLKKAKIVSGKHRAWTGIPSDNPGAQAFNIFLDGDIDSAFDAIEAGQNVCTKQENYRCSWRLELFKSRFLHTVGRGADVGSVLNTAGNMEENINGGRLITRAWPRPFSLAR